MRQCTEGNGFDEMCTGTFVYVIVPYGLRN